MLRVLLNRTYDFYKGLVLKRIRMNQTDLTSPFHRTCYICLESVGEEGIGVTIERGRATDRYAVHRNCSEKGLCRLSKTPKESEPVLR